MSAHKHPLIALFAITLLASLPARADHLLHGRVSFESGGALVRGSSDDDWSFVTMNSLVLSGDDIWVDSEGLMEMEFSGGTFVRAADQSRLRVVEVPPQAVLEGTTGSFYVQRVSRSTGSVLFKTPAADIVLGQDTHARIDVMGQGATTVTVRWGEARILSPAADPVIVREGQRAFVDPGLLPSTPVSFNRNEMDAFDTWAAERARSLATGGTAVPQSVSVTPTTMGYRELSNHGSWVYVDNTPYWRPTTVVNYVPYRYGHWSHSRAYGYTWVGNYSFCYVTSHYGRWRHHPSHGWIWTYRETWAPAWVFSARYGPNYVWAPLDPWDRPVSYGSAHFTVGSHRISLHASSFAPASALYYGPVAVRPVTPTHVTNVNVTQINIWNIYGDGTHYHRSPRYSRGHLDRFAGRDLPMRDYNPRRTIRGPEVDARTNNAARTISARLEERTRATSIEQGRAAPVRSIRTPQTASRSAQTRQAAISTDRSVRVTPQDSRVDRRAIAEDGAGTSRGVRSGDRGDAATAPDRTVRAPSAGERPAASRSLPDTTARTRATAPDARTRDGGPAERTRPTAGETRSREVTAAPPNTRGGRTVDSISTTPGARPDAADRTRGVRGTTPPTTRGESVTTERRSAPPSASAPSREPSSVRQPAQTRSRQPVTTQPRTTPQPQVRQPAQTPSRQPVTTQPRTTPQPQVRQPAQTPSRQPVTTQPRTTPQPQVRQPAQTPSRQPVTTQPRTTPQPQVRSLGSSNRQSSPPSVNRPSSPAPSRPPAVQRPSAPSTRSVSPPSRSVQQPTQRSVQPQTRSVSPPSRPTPTPNRIQPAPQTRSAPTPQRVAPAPRQRNISAPAPSRSPNVSNRAVGGGASRGESGRGR